MCIEGKGNVAILKEFHRVETVLSKYADILKRHGFDNTLFIKALTEKELIRMGIVKRGHVQFLLAQIALLPAFEIEYQVPTNVKDWLNDIGLIMYRENFRRNHIRTPKEMEILKRFDRKDIARELGITKEGLIFLFIFGFLFLLQFLAMLVHRTYTLSHYLARASYKNGKRMNTNWSFSDKRDTDFEDTEDLNAIRLIKYDEDEAFRRTFRSKKREKSAKVNMA
ncbi:chitin synthase [Plakobranchus ocellatus]|uniref:Chitin synthase n=1 Tax=Plakobranchus ocellatus TaxID=259542 RepID=A0AAV4DDU3_9GAST|nr:chitin synthase [Plakobranchus ocellatus]